MRLRLISNYYREKRVDMIFHSICWTHGLYASFTPQKNLFSGVSTTAFKNFQETRVTHDFCGFFFEKTPVDMLPP